MKRTIALFCALIFVAGCSLIFGDPRSVTNKFMAAAKSGNVEIMNQLFSKKAIEATTMDTINSNNKSFSEMVRRAHETHEYKMEEVSEHRNGDTAFISFLYRATDRTDSMGLGFYLSKEDGTWKIDHIGGRERQNLGDLLSGPSPTPAETATPPELSDEPPPVPSELPTPAQRAPISAGVLNGKATSLPKPPYPQIAKAVKASGQVNVQVLVDESGNVVTANAISGHPLLRAAAVAAARQAKFSPTKLSGQPVKVTGVLIYNFAGE